MDEKTMTVVDLLNYYITTAMKTGDKDMLSIYRLAKTEMIKQQKDRGVEESCIDHIAVYKTLKKRLTEEIEALEKGGRDVSVQKKQLDWVIGELPKPVSEEEIRLDLKSWLPEQPENCRNIGFVMQHLKLVFHGKSLDMGLASKLAREELSNLQ
jgi:uncharacterized protein YqeY